MGWFRKKKFPALDQLPRDSAWALAQGENDGMPMIVRFNETAKQYAGHPGLPIRMGIAVPLTRPNDIGLPDEDEQEQLEVIEDRLMDLLGDDGRLLLIISTGNMREFVSHVDTEPTVRRVVETLTSETTTHEVQAYAEVDKKWELFGNFV